MQSKDLVYDLLAFLEFSLDSLQPLFAFIIHFWQNFFADQVLNDAEEGSAFIIKFVYENICSQSPWSKARCMITNKPHKFLACIILFQYFEEIDHKTFGVCQFLLIELLYRLLL